MRFLPIVTAIVGFFISVSVVSAAMSSTNYQILWDSIDSGGSDVSSSASYILRDAVGNTGAGDSTSTSYQLNAGYRAGIFDQVVKFDLYVQGLSTHPAPTTFSRSIVAASTSGVAVGDVVAIVQDEGLNQVSAIGKISALGAGTITLDRVTIGASLPVIDGASDYVYKLSGSTIAWGDTLVDAPKTSLIAFEATADVQTGYTIGIVEDGNLRSAEGHDVDDVGDGAVTSANEEYGARSSDTALAASTFDAQDT